MIDTFVQYTHMHERDLVSWLTEADYDALHAALQPEMPRVHRALLPTVLSKLAREGMIEIAVSRTEITLRVAADPDAAVVRVARSCASH